MKGAGTSVISLAIPGNYPISMVTKLLNDEAASAVQIKSRVNRQSVQDALTSALHQVQGLGHKTDEMGRFVFCGEVAVPGKSKPDRVALCVKPLKPVSRKVYHCGSEFMTEPLRETLSEDATTGFIIVDGNGVLLGTVCGNVKTTIVHMRVSLPKKHRAGGQSSVRFARLREEARAVYVRKVCELVGQSFLNASKSAGTVAALVVAGCGDIKADILGSALFPPALHPIIVVSTLDVAYGGPSGFRQAIDMSASALADAKLAKERDHLKVLFDTVALTPELAAFGVTECHEALVDLRAVSELLVFEDLAVLRCVVRDASLATTTTTSGSGSDAAPATERVVFVRPTRLQTDAAAAVATAVKADVVSQEPLVDWLAREASSFGATVRFVSDRSTEGTQLARGFDGIAAVLRHPLPALMRVEDDTEDSFSDGSGGAAAFDDEFM